MYQGGDREVEARVLSSLRKIGIGLLLVTQAAGEGLSEQAKASLR